MIAATPCQKPQTRLTLAFWSPDMIPAPSWHIMTLHRSGNQDDNWIQLAYHTVARKEQGTSEGPKYIKKKSLRRRHKPSEQQISEQMGLSKNQAQRIQRFIIFPIQWFNSWPMNKRTRKGVHWSPPCADFQATKPCTCAQSLHSPCPGTCFTKNWRMAWWYLNGLV